MPGYEVKVACKDYGSHQSIVRRRKSKLTHCNLVNHIMLMNE